jgi:pyruvate formate lyase activating enzyme
MLPLYDITPFTLLDYPDTPAAILWFAGCNLRCLYCYNPDIVLNPGRISMDQALSILAKRVGFLEGVVLSGGEATLYPDLRGFCHSLKPLGYKIKLDTNGMRSDVLKELLEENLLDYVALDYKAPACEMSRICGGGSEKRFWESLDTLQSYGIDFEVRTTMHPDLLSESQIITMANKLKAMGYQNPFYVQLYREGSQTLGNIGAPTRRIDVENLSRFVTIRE